jgi:hypothetical protein
MRKNQETDDNNVVWGAAAIGQIIDRSAEQVRHLHRTGALGDAVVKKGHRTLIGNRRKLKQYPDINTDGSAAR